MTYELAQKLKEAGFPQGELVSGKFHHDKTTGELTLIPTLSELIETCGSNLYMLRYDPPATVIGGIRWKATGVGNGKNAEVYGSTPEEAIANLYIALNKKV